MGREANKISYIKKLTWILFQAKKSTVVKPIPKPIPKPNGIIDANKGYTKQPKT